MPFALNSPYLSNVVSVGKGASLRNETTSLLSYDWEVYVFLQPSTSLLKRRFKKCLLCRMFVIESEQRAFFCHADLFLSANCLVLMSFPKVVFSLKQTSLTVLHKTDFLILEISLFLENDPKL